MKTYNEIAENVFRRRDEYIAEKQLKRQRFTRTMMPICCTCLVAVIGFGALQVFLPHKQPTHAEPKNTIIINEIDYLPHELDKFLFNLVLDDFVPMDKDELNDYYGINVFPMVPTDIKEWDDSTYGIYKREGGKGEIYWDQMVLNYDNDDFSRGVNIEVKKGSLPVLDYVFGISNYDDRTDDKAKSFINGTEVVLAMSDEACYHALFMYQDVGFCVNTRGLTQDEFIAVVKSLIQ